MEPLRVYRIVQVPCGKWRRVLQRNQAQSRRKPALDSHHRKTTLVTHQKKTVTDPYCKATQSSQKHKPTLASYHRKTIFADPHHQPMLDSSHCHARKNCCPSPCSGLRVQWRWLYLALLLTFGRTSLSERTSWVYQSHTPFSIQKDFQKFVEEAGGNSRRFRFFGNFFDSDEHEAGNDKFLENGFLETPFQNEENIGMPFEENFPSTTPIKSFVENFPSTTPIKQFSEDFPLAKPTNKQIHEPPVVSRVPKSFYEDIFDHSLPADSPYRTTSFSSPKPNAITSQEKNNRERTSRKLERHEKTFLSKPYQPFSSDLLTPLPFQKHTNIEGFTSQTLGNIELFRQQSKSVSDKISQFSGFSDKDLGSFSDEIRSTENEVSRIGFLLQRRPFFDRPRRPPRKLFLGKQKQEFEEEHDSSFNTVDHPQHKPSSSSSQHKPPSSSQPETEPFSSQHRPPSPSSHPESYFGRPNFEAIVTAYEANESSQNGGPEEVSDPLTHWTLNRPHNGGGSREKAVRVLRPNPSPAGGEESLPAAGCPSEADGILYGAGAVWFEQGCQRHTCVHFRGRYFVETDSCDSEIHNTSYRCQVLVDTKASYPNCCPTYQCLSDNLGRSAQDEDAGL